MPDVVITEFMDAGPVETLKACCDVHWDKDLWDKPEKIKPLLKDAKGLIVRNRTQVTGDLLGAGPNLKVVGRLGVGLDNIDLEACKARNVKVCPATGTNNVTVAEYTICTALMLLRGSFYARDSVLAGEWPRTQYVGLEARGRTLGLLGYGMIGQSAARMAAGLEMKVIAHDPNVPADAPGWKLAEAVSVDELLKRSDVLSLHVPLLPSTRNIINADAIRKMKKGSILINTARGGVVNEDDLVAALKSGHLRGAALDVFVEEPLSAKEAARFKGLPNLILTPHISGVTVESNDAISSVTVENVMREMGLGK
ncbi:MAG: hydroxyacid dehydrogenase [Hyphomicrobiales bacterium]